MAGKRCLIKKEKCTFIFSNKTKKVIPASLQGTIDFIILVMCLRIASSRPVMGEFDYFSEVTSGTSDNSYYIFNLNFYFLRISYMRTVDNWCFNLIVP